MSLEYKQTVSFPSYELDEKIRWKDNTGNYDAINNPGGWGGPNVPIYQVGVGVRITNVCTGEQLIPTNPITQNTNPVFWFANNQQENFQVLGNNSGAYPYIYNQYDLDYDQNFVVPPGITRFPAALYMIETSVVNFAPASLLGTVINFLVAYADMDCQLASAASTTFNASCSSANQDRYEKMWAYRQMIPFLFNCPNYPAVCEVIGKFGGGTTNDGGCGCGA